MAHDTDPTAEYVVKFAKKQEQRYSAQALEDRGAKELYQGENPIEVKEPSKGDTNIRRVKAGQAGQTVDERVSVLLGDLFLRVTPRGVGEAEKHASDKLEPFLNGSFKVMQDEDPFWDDGVQDMVVQGRVCLRGPMPAPQLWGDEEIQKLTDEATETETEEDFKSASKAVEEFKRNNFPIICERVPVDSVYPQYRRRGQRELAEIVQINEMTKEDIEDEWGEIVGSNEASKIKVYEYANQRWVATVISTKDPQMVRHWEHGMKVAGRRIVPYVFEAGHKLIMGDGRLWRGILFHVKNLFETQDETLTDIRTVIREFVTSPYVATLDAEFREGSDNLQKAEDVKVEGGASKTLHLFRTPAGEEKLSRAPLPEVNMDAYRYLEWTKSLLDQQVLRPELSGGGSSGEAAVHLAHANAYAKAELRRYHKALERAGGKWARLLFASVIALSEHFPDIPDEVTVRHRDAKNKSKEIEVKPSDVEDYFPLIDATLDLNVPFNEAAAVQNASIAVEKRIVDPRTAREMFLNMENPQEIDERWAEYDMTQAAVQVVNAMLIQEVSGSVQAGDIPIQELLQQAMSLPEAAQMAIQKVLGGEGGSVPRGVSTAMNNEAREGRPQQMSQLAGTEMEAP